MVEKTKIAMNRKEPSKTKATCLSGSFSIAARELFGLMNMKDVTCKFNKLLLGIGSII